MWNWMFESGVIITGGKRRSDINATYASRDGAITPSRSVVAARESLSGVFRGSLEAYSPGACSQVSGRSDILRKHDCTHDVSVATQFFSHPIMYHKTKFPWPPPHWHFGHHRYLFMVMNTATLTQHWQSSLKVSVGLSTLQKIIIFKVFSARKLVYTLK